MADNPSRSVQEPHKPTLWQNKIILCAWYKSPSFGHRIQRTEQYDPLWRFTGQRIVGKYTYAPGRRGVGRRRHRIWPWRCWAPGCVPCRPFVLTGASTHLYIASYNALSLRRRSPGDTSHHEYPLCEGEFQAWTAGDAVVIPRAARGARAAAAQSNMPLPRRALKTWRSPSLENSRSECFPAARPDQCPGEFLSTFAGGLSHGLALIEVGCEAA